MAGPVGSTAVRQFIEEVQPRSCSTVTFMSACRAIWIGETQALNPASDDLDRGTLQAALITVDLRKRRAKRCQFVSG